MFGRLGDGKRKRKKFETNIRNNSDERARARAYSSYCNYGRADVVERSLETRRRTGVAGEGKFPLPFRKYRNAFSSDAIERREKKRPFVDIFVTVVGIRKRCRKSRRCLFSDFSWASDYA